MLDYILVPLLGFMPAVVLFAIIVILDRRRPEPIGQLFKAFAFGTFPAIIIISVAFILELCGVDISGTGPFTTAFCVAAIPEEGLKLLMLWLILRRNKYYDEMFDGIVYACCIGLGFAAFENVLYLWDFDMGVMVARASLAVPGHFLDAVMMGYFYSLARFTTKRRGLNMALTFLVPMLAHGLYDYAIMSAEYVNMWFTILIVLVIFPAIVAGSWIIAIRFMKRHLKSDSENKELAAKYAVHPKEEETAEEA